MLLKTFSACLIAVLLTVAGWRESASMQNDSPYLVLIVMDGFRPDYATLAPMHHLHDLMKRGTTYDNAWVGQMESETPTGHATIATGVYPRRHGVVGFGWRDPSTGQFTWTPTDLRLIRAGSLARTIEQSGVPTISDLIHAHDPDAVTASMSGEKYYASATMGVGADYVLYGRDTKHGEKATAIGPNVPPAASRVMSVTAQDSTPQMQDQFSASLAVQLARTVRPRALLVNLPGADIAGHLNGAMRDPADMAPVIRGDDYAIGRIVSAYQKLGLLERTIFVVTADHGMAANDRTVPVHPMYDTVRAANALALDEEFRITVGSIWLREPQRAQSLATVMAAKRFPHVEGALYRTSFDGPFTAESQTAAHLPKDVLQAYLDLANTEAGPTGPQVVLPYEEASTGLVLKHRKRLGTHGGFSWGVQHIPLVIAGPGVAHGVSHFPASLVDVAPTVERLLGLPVPAGVDGVLLADALRHPAAQERSAEQSVQPRRGDDVNAIRRHSLAQSH